MKNKEIIESFRETFKHEISKEGYEGSEMLIVPYEEMVHYLDYALSKSNKQAVREAFEAVKIEKIKGDHLTSYLSDINRGKNKAIDKINQKMEEYISKM